MGRPAVFLDRDGVINEEKNYVHRIEEFKFIDGVFDACRLLKEAGYLLVIITNQAGIARGYYTEADFNELTEWMLGEFRRHDVEIDGVYYCPHHPVYGIGEYRRECDCRKPAPGMILRAARELGIELRRSVLVGDKTSDIESGRTAGVGKCYLVETGHKLASRSTHLADAILGDIREIVIPGKIDRVKS